MFFVFFFFAMFRIAFFPIAILILVPIFGPVLKNAITLSKNSSVLFYYPFLFRINDIRKFTAKGNNN